eukprot:358176-Chlamydomonas_euryale.AAC.1
MCGACSPVCTPAVSVALHAGVALHEPTCTRCWCPAARMQPWQGACCGPSLPGWCLCGRPGQARVLQCAGEWQGFRGADARRGNGQGGCGEAAGRRVGCRDRRRRKQGRHEESAGKRGRGEACDAAERV